jgi:putative radical SAM enzyme (TIGR03279 family)
MPLRIAEVQPRSLAAKAGIQAGDTVVSINCMPVNDFFDLEYYSNDYQLDFELLNPAGEERLVTVLRQTNKTLGIGPEPYLLNSCQNHCVFCFIDQMPPSMRKSLYQKDDDYLYSYVFGNYITLNNLTQADLDRIIDQHISPLYISVHCTDMELRRSMMCYGKAFDMLEILRGLARGGISYHLQIVCVPGYNCGEKLRETLAALLDESIAALSIGVVPVGLTGFRDNLPLLKPFDAALAAETLAIIDEFRELKPIVYGADELFVQAGLDIPDTDYYGDFPQLENGIGMLRLTMMNYQKKRRSLARELDKSGIPFLILTSRSAFGTINGIAADLNKRLGKSAVRTQAIANNFLGGEVSVSGLLTAYDILGQYEASEEEGIILPSNMFNHEGLTLDDVTQVELRTRLQRPLLLADQFFEDWEWI